MVLTGRTCIAAWPTNVARHHIFTVTEGLFLPKGYRYTFRFTQGKGTLGVSALLSLALKTLYTAVGK